MISMIKNFFNKKPKLTGRQINLWEHTEWGDSIYFMDFSKRKVAGHLYDRPEVGDIINSKMTSGKIGQFLVTDVEYMADPPDMFFCNVSDIGYKE